MSKPLAPSRRLRRAATFHNASSARPPSSKPVVKRSLRKVDPQSLQLHVYADAVCRHRNSAFLGGYGIFVPLHSIRVAEPLPGSAQTLERAELRVLHAALELVHGIRARSAVIHIHSDYVIDVFNTHLPQWHQDQWRTINGRFVRNRRLWQDVFLLRSVLIDRGVSFELRNRPGDNNHDMRIANRLARHGASLFVTCNLCQKTHGRQFLHHKCQPVCNLDQCKSRVFKNIHAYSRHLYRRHLRVCEREDCPTKFECFTQQELDEHDRQVHGVHAYPCEFCGKVYSDFQHVRRHMRLRCKHAPFCMDCGKQFQSRREFEKHNAAHLANNRLGSSHSSLYDGGRGREEEDDEEEEEEVEEEEEEDMDAIIEAELRRRGRLVDVDKFGPIARRFDDDAEYALSRLGLNAAGSHLEDSLTSDEGIDEDDGTIEERIGKAAGTGSKEGMPTSLSVTDRFGRSWEIDEFGLRKRRVQSFSE